MVIPFKRKKKKKKKKKMRKLLPSTKFVWCQLKLESKAQYVFKAPRKTERKKFSLVFVYLSLKDKDFRVLFPFTKKKKSPETTSSPIWSPQGLPKNLPIFLIIT